MTELTETKIRKLIREELEDLAESKNVEEQIEEKCAEIVDEKLDEIDWADKVNDAFDWDEVDSKIASATEDKADSSDTVSEDEVGELVDGKLEDIPDAEEIVVKEDLEENIDNRIVEFFNSAEGKKFLRKAIVQQTAVLAKREEKRRTAAGLSRPDQVRTSSLRADLLKQTGPAKDDDVAELIGVDTLTSSKVMGKKKKR